MQLQAGIQLFLDVLKGGLKVVVAVLTLMQAVLKVMEIATMVLTDVVNLVLCGLMVVRTGMGRAILWVYCEHPNLQFVIAC